jgi:hypothetical protein
MYGCSSRPVQHCVIGRSLRSQKPYVNFFSPTFPSSQVTPPTRKKEDEPPHVCGPVCCPSGRLPSLRFRLPRERKSLAEPERLLDSWRALIGFFLCRKLPVLFAYNDRFRHHLHGRWRKRLVFRVRGGCGPWRRSPWSWVLLGGVSREAGER